jgi:hypothetical protein
MGRYLDPHVVIFFFIVAIINLQIKKVLSDMIGFVVCLQVGTVFTQQYYSILITSPEDSHKFYHDESILGRPGLDGGMTSITTTRVSSLQHGSSTVGSYRYP